MPTKARRRVGRDNPVSRTAWLDAIEQTQLVIRRRPDRCFVCEEPVPADAPDALMQAYRDAAHQARLAVVCGRRACRLTLQDAANGTWQCLFDALTHWPDRAIYPHGPYWVIRRPHQRTFRTDPRRTTVLDTPSANDPDDAATLPRVEEHRPVPSRRGGQHARGSRAPRRSGR